MNTLSSNLPSLLLTYYFNPAIAGFFAFGYRLLTYPLSIIGSAFSQVFFQRGAEASHENNLNKIRHYSGLHSKAIISNKQALFGSSNFTYSGINKNNELSVLIDEHDKILELSKWFDSWWEFSAEINIEELKKKIKSYKPKPNSTSSKELLMANNNIINCKYKKKLFFRR